MTHSPTGSPTSASSSSVAAVTTLPSSNSAQPLVLGHIIAGVLVGPHVTLVPTVLDEESIKVWSELKRSFLLFSPRLEFSFKKVAKCGRHLGHHRTGDGPLHAGRGPPHRSGWAGVPRTACS
ncbi:MAG: hypothetical protein IPO60_05345 [Flavobacteriales bacterium]|nr:hypothetical protein [Flavobacteriales bacterium]